jgi:hypothetical protein
MNIRLYIIYIYCVQLNSISFWDTNDKKVRELLLLIFIMKKKKLKDKCRHIQMRASRILALA